MAAKTTEFKEYKEELLPKLIPAVIPEYWYPKNEDDEEQDVTPDDGNNEVVEG